MEEFLLFFLSTFVFFIVMNKLYKKGEIISTKSSIDGRIYIVRKLPDAKKAADKLAEINKKVLRLISSLDPKKDGVDDLINNYNPDALSETVIGSKYTSYSVNKGEKISICIRGINDNTFIDDNTVLFVVIHELAHVMTEEIGHPPEFWENMKTLLKYSIDSKVYNYINYRENPVYYCGVYVDDTPYII